MNEPWYESPVCFFCDFWWTLLLALALALAGYFMRGQWLPLVISQAPMPTVAATTIPSSPTATLTPIPPSPTVVPTAAPTASNTPTTRKANPSLALDSSDTPHIAFQDLANNALIYAVLSGADWVSQIVEGSGLIPFLTLDESGMPHIAYTYPEPDVKYAVLSGDAWEITTVDADMVAGPSLVLDSAGIPHLAYCDVRPSPPNAPGQGLKYAYWTGNGWTFEQVDPAHCEFSSLALDDSGTVHIAYYDVVNDTLMYTALIGLGWRSQIVEASGLYPSLATDESGISHIVYTSSESDVKYGALHGNTWTIQTVDSGIIAGASLALDSASNPHLAYCNAHPSDPNMPGESLEYGYWTGNEWMIEQVDVVQCESPSLALDSSDNAHIAYVDTSTNKLKYAEHSSDTTWLIQMIEP